MKKAIKVVLLLLIICVGLSPLAKPHIARYKQKQEARTRATSLINELRDGKYSEVEAYLWKFYEDTSRLERGLKEHRALLTEVDFDSVKCDFLDVGKTQYATFFCPNGLVLKWSRRPEWFRPPDDDGEWVLGGFEKISKDGSVQRY